MDGKLTPGLLQAIKRNGEVTDFNVEKIKIAITKAFYAVEDNKAISSERVRDKIETLSSEVNNVFKRRMPSGGVVHIEEIQDQVELALMRAGEQPTARAYVLYREARATERKAQQKSNPNQIFYTGIDGKSHPVDVAGIQSLVQECSVGLEGINVASIVSESVKNLFNGVKESDILSTIIMSVRTRIEQEPDHTYVAARLLSREFTAASLDYLGQSHDATEKEAFVPYIKKAIELELLQPAMADYDLALLADALDTSRTNQLTYLALQTLHDRYFVKTEDEVRLETAQLFFMRVAMGLALNEASKNERAIEFYNVISQLHYMPSTPTLFNSGLPKSQLSSCYLTTIPDDLYGIYGSLRDNAMLSKWAGGLGNDWTPVRALNAHIKGTNGKSQGIVPFLKVNNDTAVAVNQGGKRKGAICAYLETWHLDIEEFLDLRKNTGDDRRRTHDMNTANWIPDLFMQRVIEDGDWTLFTPNEVPDLHDLVGLAFAERYAYYETNAKKLGLLYKTLKAADLWRKMLSMLFETGHPWMTFKDPCNLRSPQQHVGVVHSSNLCTEITLNTSADEIAVCNLGSVNLPKHIVNGVLDVVMLTNTIKTAHRILDNVIDLNYYAVPAARNSNMRHRPIGLGIMGFQDALYELGLPYGSAAAVQFADTSMELVSYLAISSSSDLAAERGRYESFEGSLWDQGILPIDSLDLVAKSRPKGMFDVDRSTTLDWDALREKVRKQGMRNSNVLAIAPTATISNICGVAQSIEPTFQNLYVKSNLSGEFTVINPYLVRALKARGLWDMVMVNDLKHYEGSVQSIARVPDDVKALFATAFEVEARWLVDAASRRQKWIDQSQSLNLYIAGANGKKLDITYKMAWLRGLKTTYYLRALGATSAEKSTINTGALNAVKMAEPEPDFSVAQAVPTACSLDNPDCEACQ